MPTVMTHAVAGAAVATLIAPGNRTALWVSMTCAMLPDIDVLGFAFGIPYESMLGHRGLTHSVAFAAAVGLLMLAKSRRLALCAFLATLSHGILDAFTNGGRGVAFFAPFGAERYFFPLTPIEVSPIGLRFFSSRGLDVLASEFLWVWCPSFLVIAAVYLFQRKRKSAR